MMTAEPGGCGCGRRAIVALTVGAVARWRQLYRHSCTGFVQILCEGRTVSDHDRKPVKPSQQLNKDRNILQPRPAFDRSSSDVKPLHTPAVAEVDRGTLAEHEHGIDGRLVLICKCGQQGSDSHFAFER